jgi:hypothetical protein|nr:MAG TPA_asm: hypothetical protein [Caudoviricetes sp.]
MFKVRCKEDISEVFEVYDVFEPVEESNDICKDCRATRIKQAQRKYAILSNKRRM